jgi:hypothetical protein
MRPFRHLAFGLVVLLAVPALAGDEKIFHLRNGRKIEGELIDDTPANYIIRLPEGGTTKLAKGMVAKVEDAPPREPPPKKPAPEVAPVATRTKPAKPKVVDENVESLRKALREVPTDPAERAKAIEAIKSGFPLRSLVAIVAEPETPAAPAPVEQLLAADLVRQSPPADVRPLLVDAVGNVDLEKGQPTQLSSVIRTVGDEGGVLENALLDEIEAVLPKDLDAQQLFNALDPLLTAPSFPRVFGWIFSVDKNNRAAVGGFCKTIVLHAQDKDAAVAPLVGMVDAEKLPPLAKLPPILEVLAYSKKTSKLLVQIVNAVERRRPNKDTTAAEIDAAIRSAYGALGAILDNDARYQLNRGIDALDLDARIRVIESIRNMPMDPPKLDKDFLNGIIDRMTPDKSEQEMSALAGVLQRLTGRNNGTDTNAWKRLVQSLPDR